MRDAPAAVSDDANIHYPPTMQNQRDLALATEFAAKCEKARETLRHRMETRGLLEKAGWRINESVRHIEGRTEMVMRPIHLRLTAPADLECVIAIDEPGDQISSNCET